MGETIKVCLISPDFIPVWSGIGTYVVSLVQNFPKDIQIHIVTVKREIPGSSQREKDHLSKNELFDRIKQRANVHFISGAKGTFFYHLKFQSACLSFIPRLCKETEIDLIHSNFPLMSDIQVKLFKGLKVPTIATVHSTIEGQHFGVKATNVKVSHLQTSDLANLVLYYPLKVCELVYLKKIRYFISVSKNMKKELEYYLKVPSEKIETIYHGVDIDRFHPDVNVEKLPHFFPSDRPVVLFSGRFVATKGINTVVKAIPEVLRKFQNVFFIFIGGGDHTFYEYYLKTLGISQHNFLFRGYIADQELPAVYSNSTVYVAPTTYEPLGIRILEAMSCGRPVIASRVGGIPEIIRDGENGFLIPPNDNKALSTRIIQLLNDDKLALSLGNNARRTVLQNFSDKKMAAETVNLYYKVLNKN